MSDPLNLKKHIREVKDFPIEGINFRDITSLIENPEAFQTTCKELIEVLKILMLRSSQALRVSFILLVQFLLNSDFLLF